MGRVAVRQILLASLKNPKEPLAGNPTPESTTYKFTLDYSSFAPDPSFCSSLATAHVSFFPLTIFESLLFHQDAYCTFVIAIAPLL